MIAADLAARFATLPVAWREALPDWDAVKSGRIAEAVGRVPGPVERQIS